MSWNCPSCGDTNDGSLLRCSCGYEVATSNAQTDAVFTATEKSVKKSVYYFRNPKTNEYIRVGNPWFIVLLIAPYYFAKKRIVLHCLFSLIAVVFTYGISNMVYAIFAQGIMVKRYRKLGWEEITKEEFEPHDPEFNRLIKGQGY